MAVSIYILFSLLEESVYFLWNRYVYGPNETKARLWKSNILGIAFLIQVHLRELRQKHIHKVSSDNQSA